jgi:hypothetical protein
MKRGAGGGRVIFYPCALDCKLQGRKGDVCTLAHMKTHGGLPAGGVSIGDRTRQRSGSAGGHGNLRRVPASAGPGEVAPVFRFDEPEPGAGKGSAALFACQGALGATGA